MTKTGRKNLRKLAKNAGISSAKTSALFSMMDYVKAVRGGIAERPGGIGCTFPNCRCQLPTVKCEREFSPSTGAR